MIRSVFRCPYVFVCFALALLVLSPLVDHETAKAAPGEVLILETSVTGGLSSAEAQAALAVGKIPVVVSAATWDSMTAAQFADYDALILGDPTCSIDEASSIIGAAMGNANEWGPVVDGNVIIIGSDPVYHDNYESGAQRLINQGIAFAVDKPEKTGAYIDLSCYYHFDPACTPVPVLDGINGGGFTVVGAGNLPGLNDVHIVATHPALAGLTDADLSNWWNSVHEGFVTWPVQFEVFAIARDPAGSYTAPDGTIGYPYILARGVEIISDIDLSPDSATNPIGTSHAVVATVTMDDPVPDSPVVGTEVTFSVIAGPHTGEGGTSTTDSSGQAAFSYVGTAPGEDIIEATFVDAAGRTQRSDRVTKEWQDISVLCGDLDDDRDVDGDDRNILAGAFRTCTGNPGFVEEADYDADGCITFSDYQEWYRCYKAFISPP